MSETRTEPFVSRTDYVAERIHAAAVYCSDGRVGEHFDDFLQNGLGLPRYDRVALPGGPGCLAGHAEAIPEERGVIGELRFLIEAHELERVVLIQHQACAFYAARLGVEPERMRSLQAADLVRAAFQIRRISPELAVEGYIASLESDGLRFDSVPVD